MKFESDIAFELDFACDRDCEFHLDLEPRVNLIVDFIANSTVSDL